MARNPFNCYATLCSSIWIHQTKLLITLELLRQAAFDLLEYMPFFGSFTTLPGWVFHI